MVCRVRCADRVVGINTGSVQRTLQASHLVYFREPLFLRTRPFGANDDHVRTVRRGDVGMVGGLCSAPPLAARRKCLMVPLYAMLVTALAALKSVLARRAARTE